MFAKILNEISKIKSQKQKISNSLEKTEFGRYVEYMYISVWLDVSYMIPNKRSFFQKKK